MLNNDAARGLLDEHRLIAHKQRLIAWTCMTLTGLTFAGMTCAGVALWQGQADGSLPGIFLINFGSLLSLCWVFFVVNYAIEYCKHHALEVRVQQNPAEAYRMVLSGRVVAWYTRFKIRPVMDEHQLAQRRKRLRACFPWLELLLTSPVVLWGGLMLLVMDSPAEKWKYVSIAAIVWGSVLLGAFAMRLLMQLVPSCWNHGLRHRHLALPQRPGAKEVFFIASQSRSEVAVSFDGLLTQFRNIGQLPPQPRENSTDKYLAKSQLVAHYSDGQIIAWSLKMIYGVALDRRRPWLIGQQGFPVEVSKVQELYQWLASEPRKELFRFCGTTYTDPEIRCTRATLLSPHLENIGTDEFPVDHRPAMVLVASFSCGQSGIVRISLLSMAGSEVGLVQLQSTDTIADLWWEIDSQPRFAGQRVALMLANGRSLDDTQTHPMRLAEVMQADSPHVPLQPTVDV